MSISINQDDYPLIFDDDGYIMGGYPPIKICENKGTKLSVEFKPTKIQSLESIVNKINKKIIYTPKKNDDVDYIML